MLFRNDGRQYESWSRMSASGGPEGGDPEHSAFMRMKYGSES